MPGLWSLQPVLVVDDDDFMRDEIVGLLGEVGYAVLGFAGADQLFAAIPEPSGVLILDLRLKGPSGLLLQQKLRHRTDVQLIFISGHADVEDAVAAMKAGAFEFLVKPFRAQALIDAVGGAFERLGRASVERREIDAVQAAFDSLTDTEREIAVLVAGGLRNKQVAYISGKAENTVKVHRARVLQKMSVTSVIELSRQLQRLGIAIDTGA